MEHEEEIIVEVGLTGWISLRSWIYGKHQSSIQAFKYKIDLCHIDLNTVYYGERKMPGRAPV